MTDPAYYTVPEAARIMRIGRNRAYELAASGELPTIRIGKLLRVPRHRFEAWLAAKEGSA